MSWPSNVLVDLKGKDFCKGKLHGPNGTHCMAGMRDVVFPNLSFHEREEVNNALREAIKIEAGERQCSFSLTGFNDRTPLSVVARVWNKGMEILKYTEKCWSKRFFYLPSPYYKYGLVDKFGESAE